MTSDGKGIEPRSDRETSAPRDIGRELERLHQTLNDKLGETGGSDRSGTRTETESREAPTGSSEEGTRGQNSDGTEVPSRYSRYFPFSILQRYLGKVGNISRVDFLLILLPLALVYSSYLEPIQRKLGDAIYNNHPPIVIHYCLPLTTKISGSLFKYKCFIDKSNDRDCAVTGFYQLQKMNSESEKNIVFNPTTRGTWPAGLYKKVEQLVQLPEIEEGFWRLRWSYTYKCTDMSRATTVHSPDMYFIKEE